MSKNLAKLLDQPERLVTRAIKKLEESNGSPSEDARLLAENSQGVRQKIADLGLDPDDTIGEELYQALLAKFDKDSSLIDKAMGISQHSPATKSLEQAGALVKELVRSDDIWVLKHSSAKELLRGQPPKKLMKQLNYRSVESLLKRQNLAEVYLALSFVESANYQKSLAKAASQLKTTDYELRSPEVITLSSLHWSSVKFNPVISNNLVGAVALSPDISQQKAPVLTMALLLLDGLEQLTHSPASGSIGQINPALIWWEQSKNLMANCQDEVVSLNYKDVAQDHLSHTAYQQRRASSAQESLWSELTRRYQSQSLQLEESLEDAKATASEKLARVEPRNLAVEYAEAIANEF